MKRIFVTALTVTLLAISLSVSASASRNDELAKELAAIGMFRGTSSGFELDRAPTRSEAAIMLTRLYGAEDKAKADYEAGTITHPFTDVSAFSSPYVAWLYANGITKGTSATTFSASKSCTLTNYAAFLLRALGYRDGVDFQYADTLSFAKGKGIDAMPTSEKFLRDDLVVMTYQALATNLKNSDAFMLESLIQNGAVNASSAEPLMTKIHNLRNVNSEIISVVPKDYGITDAMLLGEENANIPQLSLEALGAYYLHTDGAMSENSGDELYRRFMNDPDAFLNYLSRLGNQSAATDNDTAATMICREISSANVFWYDMAPEFSAVLKECQKRYPFGQISALLNVLQSAYDEAVENAKSIANPPTAETNAENDNVTEPDNSEFVRVRDYIPDIVVELMYATNRNFTRKVIYSFTDAWLRYGTVKKLSSAQDAFRANGYRLKIWDGFRPVSAQFTLWEVYPDSRYVANPNKGFSSHSRGNTVDVTLTDADGNELSMPTGFDNFTRLADRDYSDVKDAAAVTNVKMLEDTMKACGFKPYSGEWWHFSDTKSYEVNRAFEPAAHESAVQ